MGISKVILNGVVKVDLTQDTVDETNLLAGETATGADGEAVEGSIASKASADLTVSGATVTAPAGFYSAAASKSVATTTHPNPTASINSTTGVVTASHTQTTGYVTGGTTTGTLNLTTQAGKTVTPTETEQTAVAAGRYTIGAVKVGAISSTYIGSDIAQNDSDDLTASGATVTAPAGYYAEAASKAVASGTAGTPSASKGTVSNHSVSVTPSVTNTTGYITGGTKTGTAVTVSASELVSGTKTISASGTTDVTNYASASVAAGSATTPATTITANPGISVSSSGLITASVSGSQSVTPAVSAGYVSGGTAGTVSVSGSNTEQLSTQGATTITPTTSSQTAVAAGKYTTGAVTVGAIPSEYIIPSGTLAITENGEGIDVSQYAEVDVAVPGQIPTGVKYVYSDIDGEGAWDVSGYQYLSYNFDPVRDGRFRYWINLTSEDLTFSPNISMATAATYRHTGIIDWGDGTQTDYDYDTRAQRHEYANPGRYCVSALRTGGAEVFDIGAPVTADKTKIIAAEIHLLGYPNNTANLALCSNLKKVRISSQQTTIGTFASTSLNDIIIPDSATTIAASCFQDCNELKTIIIPSGVIELRSGVFNRAGSSTDKLTVTILATTPPTLGSSAFTTANLNKIYVPAASLEAYKTATNWSTYASKMEAIA